MKISPDEPAFRCYESAYNGLTIRAEFAKAAMVGLQANLDLSSQTPEKLADIAVEAADALIARLNQDEK